MVDYHNTNMKTVLKFGTLKNYYTTERYLKRFLTAKIKASDIFLLMAVSLEANITSCKWIGMLFSIRIAFTTQKWSLISIKTHIVANLFHYKGFFNVFLTFQ